MSMIYPRVRTFVSPFGKEADVGRRMKLFVAYIWIPCSQDSHWRDKKELQQCRRKFALNKHLVSSDSIASRELAYNQHLGERTCLLCYVMIHGLGKATLHPHYSAWKLQSRLNRCKHCCHLTVHEFGPHFRDSIQQKRSPLSLLNLLLRSSTNGSMKSPNSKESADPRRFNAALSCHETTSCDEENEGTSKSAQPHDTDRRDHSGRKEATNLST